MNLRHALSRLGSRLMASTPGPLDNFWYRDASGFVMPAAGVRVTEDGARQLTTVSACVKVISETVATVPLIVYREIPAGKERAPDDPLSILLKKRPNRRQTSLAFREMMTGHAALRGRAYAEMVGTSHENLELVPRHPDRVRVLETDDAGFPTLYGVRNVSETATWRPVPRAKMFVLLGPWGGQSPVEAHKEAIGLGLAMQEQAARFFGNGSRPGGVIQGPLGTVITPDQRENMKRTWNDAHQGPSNSNKVAVLEGGLEWKQIGMSAEDSQFLESRQFSVLDICRIWNVPPYKVQEYGRATWNNTEQMAIDFLTTCMLPWFRRWEEAISWHLIDDEEPIFAEFLLEGLLRGDTASRYAAYSIAGGGRAWMSPNEIRERENLNREDGLDEIATEVQGAALKDGGPSNPMREPAPDDEKPKRKAMWDAWALATAESLAKAEDRELEKAPKDPKAAQCYMSNWRMSKYGALVTAKLEPMRAVWLGAFPFNSAVALIVMAPSETSTARKAAILSILTQGAASDIAA